MLSYFFLALIFLIFGSINANFLDGQIWSPLLFPNRENYVLVVVSENCTYEKFATLLNGFNILEENSNCSECLSWTTHFNVAAKIHFSIENSSGLSLINYTALYIDSKVPNVQYVINNYVNTSIERSCHIRAIKEFIIIISDFCATTALEQILDISANDECPKLYRSGATVMPSLYESNACQISKPSENMFSFVADNITTANVKAFSNMTIWYYSTLNTSLINFFAIIKNDSLNTVLTYIDQKRFANTDLCNYGSFIGVFLIEDNNGIKNLTVMSLPINFNGKLSHNFFLNNIKNLLMTSSNRVVGSGNECGEISNYFETVTNLDYENENVQNNIMFFDYYKPCVDFKWNETKQHLDIYVLYSYFFIGSVATNYLKLISPEPEKANHVSFLKVDKSINLTYDPVCRSHLHSTNASIAYTTVFQSSSTSTTLPASATNINSDTKYYIIGGVLAIIFVILGLFSFYYFRKRRDETLRKNLQESIKLKFEMSPLEVQLSHDERLKMQIDVKNLVIDFDSILGGGSNAMVYKAFLKGESRFHFLKNSSQLYKFSNCDVAFKLPSNFGVGEINIFVRELDALITFGSHPHIISILGWTLYGEIPALITELANTELHSYVKTMRGKEELPLKQILSILWQISQALKHIATFSMVHRDVACRNVLLTESMTAKLADFGLCCHCDESFTYRASLQKRFPLKWLPIEALVDRIFSEKSDVWSFGVLCYEVFTFGSVPYPALTSVEMLEFLQQGNRLQKPNQTPEALYELMLNCWKENPADRPTFSNIGRFLRGLLEDETASYGYLTLDWNSSNNSDNESIDLE